MNWGSRPDINALAIGDGVNVPINCLHDVPKQQGTVVYIHPERRFFTVEFEETGIRESYCAYGPLT